MTATMQQATRAPEAAYWSELARRKHGGRSGERLAAFVPRVSRFLDEPTHLGPIVEVLESCRSRERRAVASTPPQHGKTELVKHAIVWLLQADPTRRHAYVTYEATRAEQISLEVQRIATEAGLTWEGSRKVWRTPQGGGLIATGIGGPLTGYGVNGVMVVDDPVKNRAEAESTTYRERTDQWFRDVAMTRVHPGASVVVVQTRWHQDDLAGRLIGRGWERINLRAVTDDGAALWPGKRPREWLDKVRAEVGEYTWASLYQGDPRPRGGALFRDVRLVERLPDGPRRYAIGVDLAYSARTHSDYSVAVVLAEVGGSYYVVDVVRAQVDAPAFGQRLRALRSTYGVKPTWYTGGTELGVVQLLAQAGVDIAAKPAKGDKFTRAQPASAAWNAGRVHLVEGGAWAADFASELTEFTGVRDPHDDQVDALVAAFDALASSAPPEDVSLIRLPRR